MALTVSDIGHDADLFRRAYPHWPHPEPERTDMTTVLSMTGLTEFGQRTLYARHGDGPLLHIGFCSEIEREYRAPDGHRWLAILWDIAAFPGQVPRDGHAGPARRSPDEILATLQARVTERGAWWLEEHANADGLQWDGATGPRDAVWDLLWSERTGLVRAVRHGRGLYGPRGEAATAQEARAEAVRIAGLIRDGKKATATLAAPAEGGDRG